MCGWPADGAPADDGPDIDALRGDRVASSSESEMLPSVMLTLGRFDRGAEAFAARFFDPAQHVSTPSRDAYASAPARGVHCGCCGCDGAALQSASAVAGCAAVGAGEVPLSFCATPLAGDVRVDFDSDGVRTL